MARNAGISVENQFTKGLITEVTGVNSPENSVSESVNIIYDRKGRAIKRKGLDYEFDYQFNSVSGVNLRAKTEFVWDTAQSGSFVVVQNGRYISFFSNSSDQSLSKSLKPFTINLTSYKASGALNEDIDNQTASFSSGKDYLFVAHPLCDPLFVKYNQGSDTISVSKITIKIRDFEGVDDGLQPGKRPGGLTNLHIYNLYNQGWWAKDQVGNQPEVYDNVLIYSTAPYPFNSFPSNSDIPWLWRKADPDDGDQVFNARQRDATQVGNSMAPKGHYVLDAFYMQRNGLTGDGPNALTTSGVPITTSGTSRPSCIAFFMGRVFYSGVDAEGYRSSVYFSQVIERDEQIGNCYQSNDPTSEHAFDLLANDGGVIKILDIGRIVDLKTFGKTLFVFAENGVWAISGTQTSPFSATDYTVSKVSSFGLFSPLSIVELGETPVWWNYEGIYALGKDQTGFESTVTKLSETTIQTFYDDIPIDSKRYAKGEFNDQANIVYWLYASEEKDDPFDYDSVLVFDVQTNAFYPLSLSVSNHKITGLVAIMGLESNIEEQVVTDTSSSTVTTVIGESITVEVSVGTSISEKLFKFVTVRRYDNLMTFSDMVSETYLDFSTSGSQEEYESYFITGYRIRGELMKKFQTNYLVVMTESLGGATEECYVQGIWDYRTSNVTGRFTNPQQVYQYFSNTTYQRRKLRIRGNGYSLQFKFFGTPGKPFIIIGWAGFETANATP